jgi:hypothetical protein
VGRSKPSYRVRRVFVPKPRHRLYLPQPLCLSAIGVSVLVSWLMGQEAKVIARRLNVSVQAVGRYLGFYRQPLKRLGLDAFHLGKRRERL